jgi:hypothetical protein
MVECRLSFVIWDGFLVSDLFNRHVLKLVGVKNFATLHALDVLGVVVPGDNSYPGMFAGGRHRIVIQLELGTLSADCSDLFGIFKREFDETLLLVR